MERDFGVFGVTENTLCPANPWREQFTNASVCTGVCRAPRAHQVLTEEMNVLLW